MAGLASISQLPLLAGAGRGYLARRLRPGFGWWMLPLSAGIQFQHNSGAFGGKLLPETLGSGCAFLDYDGDGWQDIHPDQRNGLARPQAAAIDLAALSQQPERNIY